MIEVRKPDSLSAHLYPSTMTAINSDAVIGVERRNKGKVDDHYICRWDKLVAAAPNEADILSASIVMYKAWVKNKIKEEAQSYIAETYDFDDQIQIAIGVFGDLPKMKTDMEAVRAVVLTAYGQINSATTIAEMEAIHSGITYPGIG